MLIETNSCYINPYQIVRVTKPYKTPDNLYAFDVVFNYHKEVMVYQDLTSCNTELIRLLDIVNEELKR